MGKIKFIECDSQNYNGLSQKDADTLYFVSDVGKIYKGDDLYSGGSSSEIWKDSKTSGEFYKSDEAPSSQTIGKFDGYLYATRVYNAVWNDYAELFEKGEDIEFDHLAYVKEDGKVYSAGEPSNVVGIVTNNYGHLLGGDGDPDSKDYIPISLAGRVPVEVSEEIKVGDMVAANKNGTCRKATKEDFGCIVGKCVGSDPKNRENYVLVLVGMR